MQTEAQKRAQKKYRRSKKFKDAQRKTEDKRAKELQAKRLMLIALLGNKCFICGRTPSHSNLFVFHHVNYTDSSWRKHYSGRYWQEKLLAEVEKHPENFRLLDNSCHLIVELILKNPEILTRLISVVSERQGFDLNLQLQAISSMLNFKS